ncbi:signal-transduction regulatory protein [Sulfurospirillum diekertiae]|uniref:Signal-transduction regulatory protein n=1 Tax=Sulfurospirillum diekertiae TaxID=1854492 RepID=A0A290HV64_9BACT|nr:sigma 54-interacting transcriptional regulator [Sulfurospirillum diekertiae]ATB69726.1 signal-transduction regulatory protein [Sulfurospirillum diekertiae]
MDTICISPIQDCPRYQELRVLYEIALALKGSELGIEIAFEKTLSLLKRHFYMDKSIYYALNDENNELEVLSSVGLSKRQEVLATYKVGEGATGLCAQFLEPVVIENIHQNILFLNKSCSLKKSEISYLAIPALSQNKLFGVLGVSLTQQSLCNIEEMVTILTITASLMAQSQQIYQTINDEKKRLKEEKLYYKEEILKQNEIIGHSTVIQHVLEIIGKVACTNSTIFISGETGTGKELIAKAIHNYSHRKEKPYIKLNCAAIPENLLETELFGHERGAFTDAKEMRKGRFELANEGTLFLDEVGDLSLSLQAKLLRVLQEQEFERLGGTKTIKVDVRIVAATNRDIKEMVRQGSFREDLFYRLNVIPIHSPPLRDRGDDIILLACYFLERFCRRHGKERTLLPDAQMMLKEYTWPGNIRELENSMERIVLLAPSLHVNAQVILSVLPAKTKISTKEVETKADLEELERQAIIRVLRESGGIKLKAAKKLGITNRQIGYKIQKYEICMQEYLE